MKKLIYVLIPIAAVVFALIYFNTGDKGKKTAEGDNIATDTAVTAPEDKPETTPTVEASPKLTYGIDISKFQGAEVDLLSDNDSISFIICKATEGVTYTDPDFANNWKKIQEKNLIRGAYHFYRTNDSPIHQASAFAKAIKDLDASDLPPVIDIEGGSLAGNVDIGGLHSDLLIFLEKMESHTNRKPMIYTSHSFANKYLNHPSLASYPLWIAEYDVEIPRLPKAWKETDWTFWQKSGGSYKLHSIHTDFDVFDGSIKDLNAFIENN